VNTHALRAAMMDGPHFEIDGLEAAEGALDACQAFIGPDGRGGIERFGIEVGAQDIDAVEQGFSLGLLDLALERPSRLLSGVLEGIVQGGRSSRMVALETTTVPVCGDYRDRQELCRYRSSAIARTASET
jgi:hypothetical protein